MRRGYNLWSSRGDSESKPKVEAPKSKRSLCTKEGLIGIYSDDEDLIVPTDFCEEELTIGCLNALKDMLLDISTNECLEDVISIIYVPDIIGALVTGGVADYIRTKKTKKGDALGEEKLSLYMEIEEMVRDRSYNVVLRSYSFQDKTFAAKAVAWINQECREATAKAKGKSYTPKDNKSVNNTSNSAVDQLNKKIVELTMAGKFDEAQAVAKILATMNGEKDEKEETKEQAQSEC